MKIIRSVMIQVLVGGGEFYCEGGGETWFVAIWLSFIIAFTVFLILKKGMNVEKLHYMLGVFTI